MTPQPPQEYGAGEAQYGQQFGRGGQGEGFGRQGQPFGGPSRGFGSAGGGMDLKLEEGLTEEMRVVLHDLVQSATACEWCAERCIDEGPEMSECLRLCRDVADLATLNVQLMARDSVFGPEAIEVFASAAEACARECARHGHRHCQECAEQLSRAVQSVRKMLTSFEGGAGGFQEPGMEPQGGSFQEPQRQFRSQQPRGQPFEGAQGGPPQQPQGQGGQRGGSVGRSPGHQYEQGRGQEFGQSPEQGYQEPQGHHYDWSGQFEGQPGERGPPPGREY